MPGRPSAPGGRPRAPGGRFSAAVRPGNCKPAAAPPAMPENALGSQANGGAWPGGGCCGGSCPDGCCDSAFPIGPGPSDTLPPESMRVMCGRPPAAPLPGTVVSCGGAALSCRPPRRCCAAPWPFRPAWSTQPEAPPGRCCAGEGGHTHGRGLDGGEGVRGGVQMGCDMGSQVEGGRAASAYGPQVLIMGRGSSLG